MNEGTPLWNSPASSVASVAGSIVRESTVEPTRLHNKELIPTRVTARMIRTATVVGLLVAVSFYILGGSMLSASVQDPAISGIPVHEVNIATAQTMTTATTTLRHVERAEVKNSRTEGVSDDSVLFLPGFGAPREKQYAGLVGVNSSNAGKLFYWFFETRAPMQIDDRTPLLLWLNGGPGSSSMTGLLTEMGPYRLTKERKLIPHEHSWTSIGHMLFFDQPVGTGYSSVRDDIGHVDTQEEVAEQLYRGLQIFFRRHPEYKRNPLYVCGESYAGKYVPSISHYIHVKNSESTDNDEVVINLTGIAVGNGEMWPVLQTRSVPDFAIALGLIDSQQYEDANAQISVCEELHRQGRDVDAFRVCHAVTQKIYEAAGDPFIYDIRQSGNTFADLSTLLSSYFNDDAVRRALNVPPGAPWTSVDGSVYGTSPSAPALVRHLLQDEMLDVPIGVFRDLLDNYKFLFYAGNMDGSLCNNLGVGRIIDRLAWKDTAKYRVAKRQPWMVDGKVAGLVKSAGNMSYVVVLNSGHLVPTDQPEASLDMMRRFVNNEPFFT
ncbi:Serine carboxypeptidase [Phytophthora infestans]|uniref:Carboxypeptidase n=1 Tax=Phytophthora infestans TaxID=4787 RepID=A0A833WDP0_PHYIN|nr:Serine carboxypeptidase [Phytophthora infestans]